MNGPQVLAGDIRRTGTTNLEAHHRYVHSNLASPGGSSSMVLATRSPARLEISSHFLHCQIRQLD